MGRLSCQAKATAATLLIVALAGQPSLAAAAPTAPVVDMVAPVIPLTAPMLDIEFGESDLKGETRVEQRPDRTRITLDSTILFAKDSAKLSRAARGRIEQVSDRLEKRGPGSVQVTGYTDDLGSAAYGKDLSRRRAAAVAKVMRASLPGSGFPFSVVGRGEEDPAVPNTSEANRRVNRRVVVLYEKS
jgi:outer membrane protein OmpA-like peptidoglycan-associated protein